MISVILVPVKEHARAKSRMSPLLTAQERFAVAWALMEDLIRALLPLPYPVMMLTSSARAASRAGSLGWTVFWEESQVSESASVDEASKHLAEQGVDAMLRLPADLPLVQSSDVADLLSLPIASRSAVLVPSWDHRGTNALLRTPPDLFPSQFGQDSFALHVRKAAEVNAPLQVVENARLALDLDDAHDIARFLAQPAPGETYRTLMSMNIKERLAQHAVQCNPHLGTAGDS